MPANFQDRVAVVTGASSGIGRAVAATLAAGGAYVVGIDVREEPRDERDSFAEAVETGELVVGDVSDETVVDRAFDHAADEGGDAVTIVVNCAGIGSNGRIDEISAENLRRAYEVHVEGTYNVCTRAIPAMREREDGRIVNTSSIAARTGWKGTADYAPAKGAIESLTREMAADLSPEGIRVNAVAPGFIKTGMNADVWREDRDQKFEGRVGREMAEQRTLLPYLGEPKDVAEPIAFLASDAAHFITGQVLVVDGGWTVSAW